MGSSRPRVGVFFSPALSSWSLSAAGAQRTSRISNFKRSSLYACAATRSCILLAPIPSSKPCVSCSFVGLYASAVVRHTNQPYFAPAFCVACLELPLPCLRLCKLQTCYAWLYLQEGLLPTLKIKQHPGLDGCFPTVSRLLNLCISFSLSLHIICVRALSVYVSGGNDPRRSPVLV